MTRRWFSIRVELLGGRGEQLWPYPGRVFAVGPAHTFADLARAIDNAFARWDLSHLSVFTLADGRVVTDVETGADLATSAFGVMATAALDIEVAKVMRTVEQGAQFRYVFDLGDDWTHCCTVDAGHMRPSGRPGRHTAGTDGLLGMGHHSRPVRPGLGRGRRRGKSPLQASSAAHHAGRWVATER